MPVIQAGFSRSSRALSPAASTIADAPSVIGPGQPVPEPVAVLGKHPANGGEIKVMAGRFGPYVTDGKKNATLPKGAKPEAVTLDEAVRLIDDRAAKGPAKKGGRKGARRKSK